MIYLRSTGCEKKVESKITNQKGSSISLSDFLSKKLHKSPVLPGVVPVRKLNYFSFGVHEMLEKKKKEFRLLKCIFVNYL